MYIYKLYQITYLFKIVILPTQQQKKQRQLTPPSGVARRFQAPALVRRQPVEIRQTFEKISVIFQSPKVDDF
jgi:hypothetical protein